MESRCTVVSALATKWNAMGLNLSQDGWFTTMSSQTLGIYLMSSTTETESSLGLVPPTLLYLCTVWLTM